MSDEGFARPVRHVRAQHSNIGVLAPEAERVLTIVCGGRVVAAVWPVCSPQKYIVTAIGATPLDIVGRRVVAPCQCRRRQHVLDLDRVVAVDRPRVTVVRVLAT